METKADYSSDIKTIKRIMEESSRFLSLSGLSGIIAGLLAVSGWIIAQFVILRENQDISVVKLHLIVLALTVLILALAGGFYFSIRKAGSKGQKIWTPVSRRLLLNLLIPLVSGAFFIIILYMDNLFQLIVPSMLIFYGLALVNAGKFTYSEVFYLGLLELLIGFLASIFQGNPLLFWVLGFGCLHIIYGIVMYRKYQG
jgi:hypothetical protein